MEKEKRELCSRECVVEEYSTKHRMVRAMAWLRRAVDSFKELLNISGVGKKVLWKRGQPFILAISQEEYEAAEIELVKLSQMDSYSNMYEELQKGQRPSKEAYKKFNPFLDSASGVIRCVGRQAALFRELKKLYPLLLHPDSHITKVFLRDMHEDPAKKFKICVYRSACKFCVNTALGGFF